MKKYKIVSAILLCSFLLTSCGTSPIEESTAPPVMEESVSQEESVNEQEETTEITELELQLSTSMDEEMTTNEEIVDYFIWLLEKRYTSEEYADLVKNMMSESDNHRAIATMYDQSDLKNITIQVLEKELVTTYDLQEQMELDFFYDVGTEHFGGADYRLKVVVTDAEGTAIPEGEQDWVISIEKPMYGINAFQIGKVLSAEEYDLRIEATKHPKEYAYARKFMSIATGKPFDTISDVKEEDIARFLLVFKGDGQATQEELNQLAQEHFNISELNLQDGDMFHDGIYLTPAYGPPYVSENFLRAEEVTQTKTLKLWYDYSNDMIICHTFVDGQLTSATYDNDLIYQPNYLEPKA